MNRRTIILSAIFAFYAWSLRGCETKTAETAAAPPNILFISIDTLRGDRLNCYGYDRYTVSPHIDALAADGVLFENFITTSPWTTPAHMSLMTSMYPSTHGMILSFQDLMNTGEGQVFARLPADRQTLAEVLQDRGYATGAFTGGITVEPEFGFDQGFDHFDTSMYKLNRANVDAMLAWIDAQEGPWFTFMHTFETHAPYLHTDLLPEEYAEIIPKYRERTSTLKTAESLSQHMTDASTLMAWMRTERVFQPDFCEHLYLGGILVMDRWMGELVAALKERGMYDNTIIVFTSDHGEEFAEHNERFFYDAHGHSTYEEVIHVPLIMKLPRQAEAGRRFAEVSRGIDVMPTLLDVLGVTLAVDEMQGDSLAAWWAGPTVDPNDAGRIAFTEASARADEVKSLRTDRFKYAVSIGGDIVATHGRGHFPDRFIKRELFDLQEDPGELDNLIGGDAPDPDLVKLAEAFHEQLRAFVNGQQGRAEMIELDPETARRLKALGYLE